RDAGTALDGRTGDYDAHGGPTVAEILYGSYEFQYAFFSYDSSHECDQMTAIGEPVCRQDGAPSRIPLRGICWEIRGRIHAARDVTHTGILDSRTLKRRVEVSRYKYDRVQLRRENPEKSRPSASRRVKRMDRRQSEAPGKKANRED